MKFRSIIFKSVGALVGLGMLASFQACKPVRSESAKSTAKEQEELSERTVSGLKMDFYVADEGGTAPDFDRRAPSKLMEGAIRDARGIQLKKRVILGAHKLFLVISDSMDALKIGDASYEYRSVSASNVSQEEAHRALLSYDQDRHQYFLSMDQLAKEKGELLSSMDLQILDFSFRLSDGSVSHFELRFYVNGELPSLDQVRVSQAFSEPKFTQAANAPKLSSRAISSQEGWTVLTEQYKNPLSRPLTLWFTAKDVSFQLKTRLGMRLNAVPLTGAPADEAGFEIGPRQFSVAKLDHVKLVVKEARKGGAQVISLREDSRSPVQIGPNQTLEIEWHISASDHVPPCKDGTPATWAYHACKDPEHAGMLMFKAIENMDCLPMTPGIESPQVSWPGTWAVQSYEVVGQFKNNMVLTEVIGTSEKDLRKALKEGLAVQAPVASFSSQRESQKDETANPPLAPLYSCQGIF